MKNRLIFAVIGAGYWGPNVVRNLLSCRRSDVLWVADCDPERLTVSQESFPGVQVTLDWKLPIQDERVDAVAVCTPTSTHYEIAKAALLAGKHVFVEKPMTTCHEEAEELVRLAEERGLHLMVGHIYLFHSRIRRLKHLIAAGDLGRARHFRSIRENHGPVREDVGALWDLAPHDISILLYLFDRLPQRVTAIGEQRLGRGREDSGRARLEFSEGLEAELQVNWLAPHKIRQLELEGSEARFTLDELSGNGKADMEPLKLECEAFLDAVLEGIPHPSDGRFGAHVVTVLECLQRSLASEGSPVEVNA